MKISFLHYTCGLIDRGSEISTQTLASYFAQRGHRVFVYQMGKPLEGESYRVNQVKLPFSPRSKKSTNLIGKIFERLYLDYNSLLVLAFSLKIIPKLIKGKSDIVVATNGFWQILVCKIIKIFTRSKIVVIGRAGIGWTDRDNVKLSPDLFIGLTKKASLWAKKINPKVKSQYLPNPIDIKSFLQKTRSIKLSLKKPIILSVAALTPYKNIDKLIIACSELKNVSLLIVGKGELYSKLTKLGQKYLKDRFLITTFDNEQMASVYKSCHLFVLLSDEREAFGRVFLEAMVCGLPIVTKDSKIKREIVGKAGIFVKSLDKETLASAFQRGLKMKVVDEAKKQVEKFDINRIGPKYEKAFLELLKE